MITPIGQYFVNQDQPALSSEDAEVVRRFHQLYYRRWLTERADTINLSWYGYQVFKCPFDLWVYQELLVRTRPDVVVETGTRFGGSALYLAMVLDQIDHGRVITVDIKPQPRRPEHPRITYLTGSSIDPGITEQIRQAVGSQRAMVVLDSDHTEAHVYEEMVVYSPLVRPGDYLIVEDTNANGHPVYPDFGPGPMEAVDKFLAGNGDFVIDRRCERFLLTMNPRGYLRRLQTRTPS
jgi:cephalosporin hydroxylase